MLTETCECCGLTIPSSSRHDSQELETQVSGRVVKEEFVRFFLDVVEGRTGNKGTKAKAEQEKGPKKEIDPEVDEGFYAHHDLPRTPTGQESRSRSLCTFLGFHFDTVLVPSFT